MTPLFLAIAAMAVGIAVLFVALPLLRRSQPERARIQRELETLDDRMEELDANDYARQRKALINQLKQVDEPRSVGFGLIAALILAVPLATALLYSKVGEPQGLSQENVPVAELRSELIRIANRLERDPDDFDQWARLGLAYKSIEEFTSAAHALRRALYIDERNSFIMVELAETLMFASQANRLPSESVSLLEAAVEVEPQNQKAMWLLGIGAFQESNYEQALAWWQRLESQLPDGSVRNSVREQMQRARSRLANGDPTSSGLPPGHPPIDPAPEDPAPVYLVEVAIDPALADGLSGRESVFLIARAAGGPRAPLAVRRFAVGELPTTISLSDADAMMEGMTLTNHPNIELIARVSLSGTAEAQPGDLEGRAGPVNILETAGAQVVIDNRLTP